LITLPQTLPPDTPSLYITVESYHSGVVPVQCVSSTISGRELGAVTVTYKLY